MQRLCEDRGRLFPLEAPKSFDIASLSLYYESLRSIPFDLLHAPDQTRYVLRLFCKAVEGPIELRGLEDRNYSAVDYVTGKNLGIVSGHNAHLPVEFDGNLLVEVRPQ
jgi:hypothetical protein